LQFIVLSCTAQALAHAVAPPAELAPAANPGRPTVSTPAALTPLGYVQFETGTVWAIHSTEFDTRRSLNEVVKLSVIPRLELIFQMEPFVHSEMATDIESHPGDVVAGVQGVLVPGKGKRPTISLGYLRNVHASPAPDVDIGSFRQSGTFLVSDDLWGFHADVNAVISEQAEAKVRRLQYGQTLSISHRLRKFTISEEIWHFSQPFLNSNAFGNLCAVAYAVHNNLIIDVGFNHGLSRRSTQSETFLGFTYLIPQKIWKER
jgi:hypothetical protein